jgi:hypothetical protein
MKAIKTQNTQTAPAKTKPILLYLKRTSLLLLVGTAVGCTVNKYYNYPEIPAQKVDPSKSTPIAAKILQIGQSMALSTFRITLADISVSSGPSNTHTAIVRIVDSSSGQAIDTRQVAPRSYITFQVNGKTYALYCEDTFPGFTLNEKSAKLTLYIMN